MILGERPSRAFMSMQVVWNNSIATKIRRKVNRCTDFTVAFGREVLIEMIHLNCADGIVFVLPTLNLPMPDIQADIQRGLGRGVRL